MTTYQIELDLGNSWLPVAEFFSLAEAHEYRQTECRDIVDSHIRIVSPSSVEYVEIVEQ